MASVLFYGLHPRESLLDTISDTLKSNIRKRKADSTVCNPPKKKNFENVDQFQVSVDVQQFTHEEIIVKITGTNNIIIEAKHEEIEDEHGSIYRHFVRRCILPDEYNIEEVKSILTKDGVVIITAPKKSEKKNERVIPIQKTGKTSKDLVEHNK